MGAFRFAFAAVALLLALTAEAQNISRYAGAGGTAYNGDDPAQTALTANINFPGAAAVDSTGNLYIAEGGHRIRKVTPAGVITTYHGTGTASAALADVSSPSGVAMDAAGNLYIADTSNHRIKKVAAGTLTVTIVAGTGSSGFNGDGVATASQLASPVGLAVDSAGDVYIGDSGNHRVRKVTFSTGNITTIAGSGPACTATSLFFPRGVAVAANGDVYIADTGNHLVRKLSGGVMTTLGATNFGGGCPTGFVDGPVAGARFSGPTGVAVMPNGDVLVSDAGNRRVRRIRSGSVSTLVGDGVDGSTGDNGPAAAARLSQAYGIAAGVSGTYAYYIADTFMNHRIRKVAPVAPAAPTLDSATAGNGQASLAFTPSANDGGAPAASFNASCTPGPVSQGGVASPIVVTGLSNGTQYTCSVTATNVAGASVASNTLNVTPGITPSITSAAPAGGTVGIAYTHTYTATGFPAPTFAVTANVLPGGLTLAPSGSVTGTPTTAGTFPGTVTASNGVAPASPQPFSIAIAPGSQAIDFAPLPDRAIGTGPTFPLSATGGASGNPVTFTSTTTGTCTATGTNGATLTINAAGTCSIAADQAGNADYAAAPQVVRSFTITMPQPAISLSAPSIEIGGQSMGTTSPARSVTVTNTGQAALTVSGLTAPDPQFAYSHNCVNIFPADTCAITATLTPAPTGAAFNSSTPVSTTLSIASNAPFSPHTLALTGAAEKSLVTHYYHSILRRDPDAGGKAYWAAEADRLATLGANPNEAWFAMSAAFYFSPEYLALNRTPTGYVTDLYNTFFNRAPDSGGLNFWVGQMASGMPREVALVSFMFSIEFGNFTQAIFGNTAVRAEIDAVMDFYRGLLSRLPDSGGFNFWAGRFRAAQCQGAAAVTAEAESISSQFALSPEYSARGRTNSQFVGDLYNAFLRRGGDLGGVQFWIGQIDSGAQTREQVRVQFRNSPEFGARVGAIISAGCLP